MLLLLIRNKWSGFRKKTKKNKWSGILVHNTPNTPVEGTIF